MQTRETSFKKHTIKNPPPWRTLQFHARIRSIEQSQASNTTVTGSQEAREPGSQGAKGPTHDQRTSYPHHPLKTQLCGPQTTHFGDHGNIP